MLWIDGRRRRRRDQTAQSKQSVLAGILLANLVPDLAKSCLEWWDQPRQSSRVPSSPSSSSSYILIGRYCRLLHHSLLLFAHRALTPEDSSSCSTLVTEVESLTPARYEKSSPARVPEVAGRKRVFARSAEMVHVGTLGLRGPLTLLGSPPHSISLSTLGDNAAAPSLRWFLSLRHPNLPASDPEVTDAPRLGRWLPA